MKTLVARRTVLSCFSRRVWMLLLLSQVVGMSVAADTEAKRLSETATAASPIRAVWVECQSAELRSRKNCEKLIDQLRETNVDDIFVEVRSMGDAYYRSDLAPMAASLPEDFPDPLGAILQLAHQQHARPLRVHAVLNVLRLYNDSFPLPPAKQHLLKTHPDWLSRDSLGNARDKDRNSYLDPGVPDVQDYLASVALELVKRYPLDGVHFAGLRYPGLEMDWGYNSAALRQFRRETGFMQGTPAKEAENWAQWRADQLTRLLECLAAAARQTSATLVVSVSALASGSPPDPKTTSTPDYRRALQDWPLWGRSGLVDWIVLEDYHEQETEQKEFVQWIDHARKEKGKARLIVGVSGVRNLDSAVLMQLRLALAHEADGVLLYSYQKPAVNIATSNSFLELLGRTVFSPTYVLPPFINEAILSQASAQPVENVADAGKPLNLPPPLPLPEPELIPETVSETDIQVSASRALLGLDKLTPLEPRQGKGWRAAQVVEETLDLKNVPPPPEPDFLGSGWLRVKMKNGTSFVGQKVGSGDETSVFQTRKFGVKLTLRNSQILEAKPYGLPR